MAHSSNIVVWKQIEQAIVQPKVRYADCISILFLGLIQTILFANFSLKNSNGFERDVGVTSQ